jgi:hypothetical protein
MRNTVPRRRLGRGVYYFCYVCRSCIGAGGLNCQAHDWSAAAAATSATLPAAAAIITRKMAFQTRGLNVNDRRTAVASTRSSMVIVRGCPPVDEFEIRPGRTPELPWLRYQTAEEVDEHRVLIAAVPR